VAGVSVVLASALLAVPAGAAVPCPRAATVLDPFPGCSLQECREREFDEAELQAGPIDGTGDFPKKFVEGRLSIQTYTCPAALTVEEIARRAKATLGRSGFVVVYAGDMFVSDLPGFTARRGGQWVQVASETFGEQTGYTVTAVAPPAVPPRARRAVKRP
jgi:hypothetical protein